MGIAVVSDLSAWASAFPGHEVQKKYPESLRRWLRNPGTKSCLIDGIAQMFEDRWSNQRNSKKRAWDFIDEGNDDDDNDVLTLSSSRRGGVQRFSDDEDDDWDKGAASSVASKSDWRLAEDDWDDTPNTPKMKRQLFASPTVKGSNTDLGAQASSPVHRSRRGTDMETFILEEDDDDDDSDTEKIQAYVQWPRGAVVQAMAKVKCARDVIGDKKQSMSKEEFQNLLSSTPVAVLALKGLDKTPAQLRAMTRMPKQDNLKKLFDKFIAMCEDVEMFYESQQPPASSSSAPPQPPLTDCSPTPQECEETLPAQDPLDAPTERTTEERSSGACAEAKELSQPTED